MLTELTTESGSVYIEAAMDCVHAICDEMISVECRHRNFNSYLLIRTANKTLPSLNIFVARNTWHPFAEHILTNTGLQKIAT